VYILFYAIWGSRPTHALPDPQPVGVDPARA
jgi:hypothetical protein